MLKETIERGIVPGTKIVTHEFTFSVQHTAEEELLREHLDYIRNMSAKRLRNELYGSLEIQLYKMYEKAMSGQYLEAQEAFDNIFSCIGEKINDLTAK